MSRAELEEWDWDWKPMMMEADPWAYSIIGALIVGLSGVAPILFISIPAIPDSKKSTGDAPVFGRTLKLLLSFGVGGLLGDVFLHLLPEIWSTMNLNKHEEHKEVGMWVIAGMLSFVCLQMLLSHCPIEASNSLNDCDIRRQIQRHVTGYLNLLANSIDNFAHGLAVAGSFLVSTKVGLATTFAILVHEVPHEVGDFAILMRAGFTRWDAARAQLLTACIGIMGALAALSIGSDKAERGAWWILPFTSGGFLTVALVNVLPDLLKESTDLWEAIKDFSALLFGILAMALVTRCLDISPT
ncbi:unnamed protein product [Darwinula stevensoni]|uniref:Uncharacterized protein n=1 Tax=Darwinula stevensoni TaxID=69355 RepID=A0A7R8X9R9_9CRUS|nr:unnamed protein product [Darwinula stevensoni]CAG0891351.1 unnamed protein product [Darwinula stevensoni]